MVERVTAATSGSSASPGPSAFQSADPCPAVALACHRLSRPNKPLFEQVRSLGVVS